MSSLRRGRRRLKMTVTDISRKTKGSNSGAESVMLEAAAVTRLLVAERILDYSGHVSARIPGRDAFVVQIGSQSRAELSPETMLVVDYDGKVLERNGQPPSELPIHLEILKARPDVEAVLHSHMELAIAFTMMEGVKLVPMRARASRPIPIRATSSIPSRAGPWPRHSVRITWC